MRLETKELPKEVTVPKECECPRSRPIIRYGSVSLYTLPRIKPWFNYKQELFSCGAAYIAVQFPIPKFLAKKFI